MTAKQVAVILAAYPRKAPAARAARALVRDGLLACATVAPGATAFYRWEGRSVEEGSVLLWGKTTLRGAAKAVEAIRALHPDRVPEILVLKTAGALPAYAAWVTAAVGGKR
ncbi:MAG TPA: divalent cation tolerance protein CutA [Acidobacteriota bacterium]|nr:divalent cation tolerance protein CutA [Acidobacteriota bacterium]